MLVGNTFPMTLLRRRVVATPVGIDLLRQEIARRPVASFWGHENTLEAASQIAGASLKPARSRPILTLDAEALPTLDGHTFHECWVLSPNYVTDLRPASGEEIDAKQIAEWKVLRLEWQ